MSEWKIKRGEQEFTADNSAMLFNWATSGRILPTDYVHNPVLDRWMIASEVPELATAFQKPKPSSAARGSCGLAIALFLFAVLVGMIGMGKGIAVLLTAAAFVLAIIGAVLYVLKR